MRNIRFRGKRIDNDEWVYGWYTKRYDTLSRENGAMKHLIDTFDQMTIWGSTGNVINTYRVDPSTVGQFTGLTDKNGKEIYEGDVIRVTFETDCMPENEPKTWSEFFEVVFDDYYHAWFTKLCDGDLGEWLYEYDNDCEVIGNIYDNEVTP